MIGDTVVLKRVLIPCIGLMKVKCEAASEEPKSPLKCRPSELPFYCDEKKQSLDCTQDDIGLIEPSEFEKKTSQIRKELFTTVELISNYVNTVTDKVNVDQVKEWTAYLQEEENVAPRAGAIALGGLTGLIFGLRGGIFRKVFYTTAGTLTMTAVCYPKTTAEYSHLVIDDTRRYLTIAYNFVYGVKPGDPQKELPSLPSIPTSLSEAWSLTSSIGRSAKSLLLGESKDSNDSKVNVVNIENLGQNTEDMNTSSASCTRNDLNKSSDTSCANTPSSIDPTLSPERDEVKSRTIKIDIKTKLDEPMKNTDKQ